jgi:hypothetical protein
MVARWHSTLIDYQALQAAARVLHPEVSDHVKQALTLARDLVPGSKIEIAGKHVRAFPTTGRHQAWTQLLKAHLTHLKPEWGTMLTEASVLFTDDDASDFVLVPDLAGWESHPPSDFDIGGVIDILPTFVVEVAAVGDSKRKQHKIKLYGKRGTILWYFEMGKNYVEIYVGGEMKGVFSTVPVVEGNPFGVRVDIAAVSKALGPVQRSRVKHKKAAKTEE